MHFRSLVAAVALVSAGCLTAVPEQRCFTDAGCADGGVGGGTGGGSSATGGGAGGGSAGGAGGGPGAGGGSGGGTAGGSGGSGGSGGGSAIDAGSCNCTNALGCQIGDSPVGCGSHGGTCAVCMVGEQCVAGACVTGACGPSSCTGCCTNNICITSIGQTRFACGKLGASCTMCPMGDACTAGTCAPAVCDATTCPTGCCVQGQCLTQTNRFACGTGGAMCQMCPMNNVCASGVCQAAPDAGPPPPGDGGVSAVGAPCTSSQACRPPQGAQCIQENQFGQSTGYTGGYCTAQCGGQAGACSSGVCVTEQFFGFPQSTCRASCLVPSDCRVGYVCVSNMGSIGGYCRPNCANGGLAACAQGTTCGDAGTCF